MSECFTISRKEVDRASVMRQIQSRRLSKRAAAKQLSLSERQVYRLYARFCSDGDVGLISKKRGKRSNRALDDDLRLCVGLHRTKLDATG